ncbi:MAG: Hsp70 family protein [Catenulispora sp.]|nr:Hsp70 family protein [Catenulispora sp.]
MTDTGLLHSIDFGTTTSAIIVTEPDGTRTEIADPAAPFGPPSIRTAICVQRYGTLLVGAAAERSKMRFPGAYRAEFKPDFGDPTPTMLGGTAMTADDMAVHVLRFLREQAQAVVPGAPERVVVTIPVSWEAGRRALMRSVAGRAGYGDAVVELVPEPLAAMAYAFDQGGAPAERITTLVYDLGGGTFDCAVARGVGGWYEVLGEPGGLDDLGGGTLDRLLLGRLLADAAAAGAVGPPPAAADDGEDAIRRRLTLQETCEHIKCVLSDQESCHSVLTEFTPLREVSVTRPEFEDLIRHLLDETVGECGRLLARLGLAWDDVDRVVPVGGSSRIPLVQNLLARAGRATVLRIVDPELAVVRGAALLGRAALLDTAPRRVFVNGRAKVVNTSEIGFEELVKLAFEHPPAGAYVTFTVTYSRAAGERPQGSLTEGSHVRIQDGTIFNVTATDKS